MSYTTVSSAYGSSACIPATDSHALAYLRIRHLAIGTNPCEYQTMSPRKRKVFIALKMAGIAGQDKLAGVFRYLNERYGERSPWDVRLVRTGSELTADVLRAAITDVRPVGRREPEAAGRSVLRERRQGIRPRQASFRSQVPRATGTKHPRRHNGTAIRRGEETARRHTGQNGRDSVVLRIQESDIPTC